MKLVEQHILDGRMILTENAKVIFDNINIKLADNEVVIIMVIICHEKRCYMVYASNKLFLNDPNKLGGVYSRVAE